jgi:hypothetical protein
LTVLIFRIAQMITKKDIDLMLKKIKKHTVSKFLFYTNKGFVY